MKALRYLVSFAALALLLCGAWPAEAATITYVEETIGTGALGSSSFTNSLVRLTLVGDTIIAHPGSGLFLNGGIATVYVANIGTATFTDTMWTFANQNLVPAAVGISDYTSNALVLGTYNTIFASYALNTSLGPISGGSLFSHYIPGVNKYIFPTTQGGFWLSSVGDSTFTANVNAVPVPAALFLLGSGLVGLLGFRRSIK